jgi:hypothetical protein
MEDSRPQFTYYTPPAQGAKFAPMDEERLIKKVVPRIEEGLLEGIPETAAKLYEVLGGEKEEDGNSKDIL